MSIHLKSGSRPGSCIYIICGGHPRIGGCILCLKKESFAPPKMHNSSGKSKRFKTVSEEELIDLQETKAITLYLRNIKYDLKLFERRKRFD